VAKNNRAMEEDDMKRTVHLEVVEGEQVLEVTRKLQPSIAISSFAKEVFLRHPDMQP
jgi:hypothetical protein